MLFSYLDDDDVSTMLLWNQGKMDIVSNGCNLPKEDGGFYKYCDVMVLWDGDAA